MSYRTSVGRLAVVYCLIGMAVAAVVLVRMGTLFTHMNLPSLIGVVASAAVAWGMGWWLAPGFKKARNLLLPIILGTLVAYAAVLVSGVSSTIVARVAEGNYSDAGMMSDLALASWMVFRIMLLFGWIPALALGAVFGLHVRYSLRSAE